VFERRWALTILEFAIGALREEYESRGESALFEELLAFSGFASSGEEAYHDAAARTGRSASAMRKVVFDFRKRQRELLRALAADTVSDAADADTELSALLLACETASPEAAAARAPTALGDARPEQVLARAMDPEKISTPAFLLNWIPPTLREVATLFPQYEIVCMLGRGGMGAVYQARQISLDRIVAIKLLPLEISVNRVFAERFRREARAMGKLSHPNIIAVFEFGQTSEGHLFFVMEYVDGAMLHDFIHGSEEPLPPAEALGFIEQICEALAYAHRKGIVHRDIKPTNVMVTREGRVKVADFGLARLTGAASAEQWGSTMSGTIMGTPDYMAPEQKRGMNVDHRADIYALGVVLYEALCRETPQGAFILPSKRFGLDVRIDEIITRALAPHAAERFQSTVEMRLAIEAVRPTVALAHGRNLPASKGEIASVPPPTPAQETEAPMPQRRSRIPLYAGIAAIVIVTSTLVFVFSPRKPKPSVPVKPAKSVATSRERGEENRASAVPGAAVVIANSTPSPILPAPSEEQNTRDSPTLTNTTGPPTKESPFAAAPTPTPPIEATTKTAPPEIPKPQSPTAKWLAEQEPQRQAAFAKEVSGPFDKGVAELKKQYLAVLETQLAAATKAAKLDDAVALRAERERLAAGGDVPAEDEALAPPSLKTLRATYRTAFNKLDTERFTKAKIVHARFDATLAQSQDALTQRQRLDEALEVKTQRDALSVAWLKPPVATATSLPATPPSPATPKPALGQTMLPPAPKPRKMKPTELVERLLAMGAGIEGAPPGSGITRVQSAAQAQADKFAIRTVDLLTPAANLTESDLGIVEHLGEVNEVRLGGTAAVDSTVEKLRDSPGLQSLTLRTTNKLTATTFKSIAAMPALRTLDLNVPGGTEDLAALGKARKLEKLSLVRQSFEEQDFAAIAAIPALKSLTINSTDLVPPAAWARLATAKNLTELSFGQSKVNRAMLIEVGKLASLETIEFGSIPMNDDHIAPLAGLKSLRYLVTSSIATINGSAFTTWPLRPTMKTLCLYSKSSITDEALRAIATAFPKLERLDVTANTGEATAAGFAHLSRLRELRHLELTGDAVNDAIVAEISRCDQLSHVNLADAHVTEAGVQSLAKLPALSELIWSDPPVNDAALKAYRRLRTLTALRIGRDAARETEQSLKATLPKVNIFR
jgi:serine/threonine protein kinase